MAQKVKQVRECDRDLKPTPASTTVRFSYLDVHYEIDLCEKHASDLDREMAGWTRLAREVDGPTKFFDTEKQEAWRDTLTREDEHRRDVAGPTVPHGAQLLHHGEDEDDDWSGQIPDYDQWCMTPHALERADERGFSRDECVQAAVAPERVFLDPHQDRRRHHRGRVCVIVNVQKRAILSVMFRYRTDWVEFDRRVNQEKELANAR